MWQHNPFSASRIRPGQIRYIFPAGLSSALLVERLAAAEWRGQIVGPHGSGKTTLVHSLLEPLVDTGRQPWLVTLRDSQRRLPPRWAQQASAASADLIVVDGYEQLGWPARRRLQFACWRRGWGLLVIAHRDVGYPTLFQTEASLSVARAVVAVCLPPRDCHLAADDVARAFEGARGNVRETLFALYDRYERAIRL